MTVPQIDQPLRESIMMIQYDRLTGTFVARDGEGSGAVSEVYAKLNGALTQIRTWLDLKLQHGRYAHGFLAELVVNSVHPLFDIHVIYDEIGKLEGTDTTPSKTKKSQRMRRPLHDLWHKHYFQHSFMMRNLLLEQSKCAKMVAGKLYLRRTTESMFVNASTRSPMR